MHCPLITNEEHQKLSKRSGHSSYEDLIEQGFLTEAVVNFVALLGWSPTENREIYSLEELVKVFDYHHISKSPAVFDMVKMKWMNGEYIKAMDPAQFCEMALPYLKQALTKEYDFEKIAAMVQTRIETFAEIPDMVDFFEQMPEYEKSLYCHKRSKSTEESSLEILKDVLPLLEDEENFSNDALYEILSGYAKEKEYKVGKVIWPVRIAVSGKAATPAGATEIMEVIGKEESCRRIQAAIEKLSEHE